MKNVKCSFCESELKRRQTKTDRYFCNIECKAKWQVLQREKQGYTKGWLINEYHTLGKTCNQIAREINKDPKRVWEWMKNYGIDINPRGSNYFDNLDMTGKTWLGRKHKESTKQKIREARIKDGHVPYLKNGEHWLKGVPREEHPIWKGGLTPERQKVYSSLEWSEAVKQVWKRDNATCQNCGKHHNEYKNRGTFHIHHIVSFMIKEKRTDVDNLILLCRDCHLWVHSKKNKNNKFIDNGN